MLDLDLAGARTALVLSVVVALAGCSAVGSWTRGAAPSTPSRPATVERDQEPRAEGAPAEPGENGRAAVDIALRYVGTPYRWGGASPDGFDCSGLVSYVYSRVGVSLPHNAAEQYRYGTPVSRNELQPGDLLFFDRLRHNGIYVGDGKFVHARKTGRHVGLARLDEPWYESKWVGARRL